MIEKTDVATLMRDMRDLADRIIDAEGENNNGEVGRIIDMYDAADTTFKAENILLVLNAFEAERQRADEATRVIDQSNGDRDRLINDIKATQVALNISRHDLKRQTELKEKAQDANVTVTKNSDRWMSRALSAEAQLVALRDALKALNNFTGSL